MNFIDEDDDDNFMDQTVDEDYDPQETRAEMEAARRIKNLPILRGRACGTDAAIVETINKEKTC